MEPPKVWSSMIIERPFVKLEVISIHTTCDMISVSNGPGNPQDGRVRKGKTVWFGSRTVYQTELLILGGTKSDP